MTTGCTLYQNFSFGGFSLWWVGTGAFLLLGLLALGGYGGIGRTLAGIALFTDCFLLLVMILTLPCFACMLEAALLAGCYGAFRAVPGSGRRGKTSFRLPSACHMGNSFCADGRIRRAGGGASVGDAGAAIH